MRTFLLTILLYISIIPSPAEPYLQPPPPGAGKVDEPPQQPSNDETKESYSGQQGAEDNSFVTKKIPTLQSSQKSTETPDKQNGQSSSDRWLVWLTGALVLVGATQTYVFWVQAGRLKVTIQTMRDIDKGQSENVKASIAIAKQSADAAKASADALPSIERAYLFIDPNIEYKEEFVRTDPNSIPLGNSDDTVGIEITIRYRFFNHGRTPAIIRDDNTILEYFDYYPSRISERTNAIPPGLVVGTGIPSRDGTISEIFPPNRINDVKEGRGLLLLYGYVAYDDIFGKPHTNWFCWEYNIVMSSSNRFILSQNTDLNHHT